MEKTYERELTKEQLNIAIGSGINMKKLAYFINNIEEEQFEQVQEVLTNMYNLRKEIGEYKLNKAYGQQDVDDHFMMHETETPKRDDVVAPKQEEVSDEEAEYRVRMRNKKEAMAKVPTEHEENMMFDEEIVHIINSRKNELEGFMMMNKEAQQAYLIKKNFNITRINNDFKAITNPYVALNSAEMLIFYFNSGSKSRLSYEDGVKLLERLMDAMDDYKQLLSGPRKLTINPDSLQGRYENVPNSRIAKELASARMLIPMLSKYLSEFNKETR